jgi:hypothetical protein
MRDCDDFPCRTFKSGTYPFSENYLNMQERRRVELRDFPETAKTETTPEFWSRLEKMDSSLVSSFSGAVSEGKGIYSFNSLGETLSVNVNERKIYKKTGGSSKRTILKIVFNLVFCKHQTLVFDFFVR